jgi:hypothetical protein
LDAELDVGAAGEAVGGVGPLVHCMVELVVETVLLPLDGTPELELLWVAPGVGELVGEDGGLWAGDDGGLCAGEDTGVCAGETVGLDCGLPETAGDTLTLGISGLGADGQEMAGEGLIGLPLPVAAGPEPPPFPGPGCPLPDVLPPPVPPPDDDPGEDEPIFPIACRTPGTAKAVPANRSTPAAASTGLSQTVPSRRRTGRVPASVAASARRPVVRAVAANAVRAAPSGTATAARHRGSFRRAVA